jgi:anaerobic selenocysteine-containing dehydrogenase
MLDMKMKIKKIADEIGISVNWDQYVPFISWFPCTPHLVEDPQYDLYCFSYRDILHTGSATMQQPWLDEASKMNPYTYNITMSPKTMMEKNLEDGDAIELESSFGHKAKGIAKSKRGQHPETVGIAATAGHWAKGQPIARGKGTNFNLLMEARFEKSDPITFNLETCVKVKVRKIKGE